jgi:hypothetical protein
MNQHLYLQYAALPVPRFDPNAVDEETYFEFLHLEAEIAGWYSRGDLSEELTRTFTDRLKLIMERTSPDSNSEFGTSVGLLLDAVSFE